MSLAEQITYMVKQLPEPELVLLFEIIKRFLPDDIATPDDLAAIAAARDEYRRGETVKGEDIDWN